MITHAVKVFVATLTLALAVGFLAEYILRDPEVQAPDCPIRDRVYWHELFTAYWDAFREAPDTMTEEEAHGEARAAAIIYVEIYGMPLCAVFGAAGDEIHPPAAYGLPRFQ